MIWIAGGLLTFFLYLIYDLNSVLWQKKILHGFFFLGNILLAGATVVQILEAVSEVRLGACFWIFAVLSGVFLLLLIDTLFFALPFECTYLEVGKKPCVCDFGMYALCRHPGVLWFFLFYFCLGIALYPAELIYAGMFYSILNLCYVIFQDHWTFPLTFADYENYKRTTPFLIPNPRSIRRAFETRRSKQSK